MAQYVFDFCREGNAEIIAIKTREPITLLPTRGSTFLWQLTTWLFTVSFELEIAITVIYWLFLGPPATYMSYISHMLPCIFLAIDFILNLVVVELPLAIWSTLLVIIYLCVNWIYVALVTFKPIYGIVKWDTWSAILLNFGLYGIALPVGLHVILWLLTWAKLAALFPEPRRDPEEPDPFVYHEDEPFFYF